MWAVYVVFFVAFILTLDYFLLDKRQHELAMKLNFPPRLPLIGHAWMVINVQAKDMYKFALKMAKTYVLKNPKVMAIYMGNGLEIALADSKYIEKMLTSIKFITKSSLYSFLGEALGDGLLFSTNKKWLERRKIITPTFHFKILRQFFDVFQKQSEKLTEELERISEGEIFDITPITSMMVLKSLCETAMGCEINEKDYSYMDAVKKLRYLVATSFLTPWHRIKCIYNLTPTKRAQDKYKKIIDDFTTTLIEERRKNLTKLDENLNIVNIDDDDFGLKKKMCLLDVLLMSKIDDKHLSNSDIREEVNIFTFAGHDTTTTAICSSLYLLSRNPEVQKKLNAEIRECLGDNSLTFDLLNNFKYLDLVVKEALRLFPPVPIISRRLFEEFEFDDFKGPKNANYNVSLIFLHRNPENYENPEEFIPERFLKDIQPFQFLPFSAGHRNCIGQKFAMINVKTTLINILRKFEILPGQIDAEIEIHITLKTNGFYIGLRRK